MTTVEIKGEPREERTYKVGDAFIENDDVYILAPADTWNKVLMVLLNRGATNRGATNGCAKKVSDWDKIPHSEFNKLYPNFTPCDLHITATPKP